MGDFFRQIGGVPCIIERYVWDGQTMLEVQIYRRNKDSQIYAARVDGVGYVALLKSYRVLRNKIMKSEYTVDELMKMVDDRDSK